MFTRTPEGVTVTLSEVEYNQLLIVLGWATARAGMDGKEYIQHLAVETAKAINDGSPNWVRLLETTLHY